MIKQISYDEEIGRTWLTAQYGDRTVKFAHPPVQGTHQECYQAIKKDSELNAAEGLDLAILTNGAYTSKKPTWKSIRGNFQSGWVRVPMRNLWLPKGSIKGDNGLSGVLTERDVEGLGRSTNMEIPDLSQFKENKGIYTPKDGSKVFISADNYKLGEHTTKSFAKDGYAIRVLTPEGAELFAKTAVDAGKVPYIWGIDVNSTKTPEQRVSLLYEGGVGLYLGGVGNWSGNGDIHAFGVSAPSKASK